MGKRGPPPRPTKLKILRGNPGEHKLNDREPEPPTDGIVRPDYLCPVSAAKWDELLPLLQAMKVMTRADVDALARYCTMFAEWLDCTKVIREGGYAVERIGRAGAYTEQRPEVAMRNTLAIQMRQLESDFGLSPSARSSLKVESNGKAQDPVSRFIARPSSG